MCFFQGYFLLPLLCPVLQLWEWGKQTNAARRRTRRSSHRFLCFLGLGSKWQNDRLILRSAEPQTDSGFSYSPSGVRWGSSWKYGNDHRWFDTLRRARDIKNMEISHPSSSCDMYRRRCIIRWNAFAWKRRKKPWQAINKHGLDSSQGYCVPCLINNVTSVCVQLVFFEFFQLFPIFVLFAIFFWK